MTAASSIYAMWFDRPFLQAEALCIAEYAHAPENRTCAPAKPLSETILSRISLIILSQYTIFFFLIQLSVRRKIGV